MSLRLPEDLDDAYEFLKLTPGGFSAWVIDKLREVQVDHDLLNRLRELERHK